MEAKDKLGIRGKLHIELFDAEGKLKDERFETNAVTALGDAHVAECLTDNSATYMGWMAVGTGTGGTTALNVESDRNALTSTTQGSGAADNDVVYVGDWAAGDATAALTEAGILNNATVGNGGVLFVYATFSVINKGAADTLKITWTVTCGA